MTNTKNEKINPIKAWILKKKFFLKNPVKLFRITTETGERLLSVQFFGRNGVKERYLFQIKEELNPETQKPVLWPKRWIVENRNDPEEGCVMMSIDNPAKTAERWWNEMYSVKEERLAANVDSTSASKPVADEISRHSP